MLEYKNALQRNTTDEYILNITKSDAPGDISATFLLTADEEHLLTFGAKLGTTKENGRWPTYTVGVEQTEQVQRYLRSKGCVWENKPEE